MATEIIW